MIERDAAVQLLLQQGIDPAMMQHAQASEAVLQALGMHFGENAELWGRTGLLHDVDYARTKHTPEKHGLEAMTTLAGMLPDDALYAIRAHNSECTGTEPKSRFDFALRAGETITGMIIAAALVRPTGIEGMEPKSLKKKMKDKSFAASVSRERIKECEKIDLSLDDFLRISIDAMTKADIW